MGPVRTMISSAWTDLQSRFGTICTNNGVTTPHYVFGETDWFSRMKYPAFFLTADFVRQETSGQLSEQIAATLDLVLVHTSSRPDTLETNSLDYIDSMLELIRDDHTFGGACTIGTFVSSDLYAGSQDGRDLAVVIMTIELRKEVRT